MVLLCYIKIINDALCAVAVAVSFFYFLIKAHLEVFYFFLNFHSIVIKMCIISLLKNAHDTLYPFIVTFNVVESKLVVLQKKTINGN